MADRLREVVRGLADLGTGFVDAFVRDNRVLPPVLAVLALFVIAWILAGALVDVSRQEPVAHKADLAQSADAPGPDPAAPGVETPDVDSYAAYRSKDPFRELLAPEKTAQEQTTTRPEGTNSPATTPGGTSPGGRNTARDTDGDGLPARREQTIGSDPNTQDTDGDGIPDGADADANGDGRPDVGAAVPGGAQDGASGASGGGRAVGRGGDLLDSGGALPVP